MNTYPWPREGPRPPRHRLLDRCAWQPWAFINDHGLPLLEMPTDRFMIVAEARAIIRRMRGDDPHAYTGTVNFGGPPSAR